MRKIFYHEDDYCQLELVAADNATWVAQQMGKIDEFADAHQSGLGWTDMFLRSDNPTSFASLGISRVQFTQAIPISMPAFDRVLTGYSSHETDSQCTIAFGPNEDLTVFAEYNELDIISAVWFNFCITTTAERETALELVKALSHWPVMIADWGWSVLLDVKDENAFNQYFSERVRVFGESRLSKS